MIRLLFILLGLAFVLYSIFTCLHKKKRRGVESSTTPKDLEMKKCDFCGEYVEKQPDFKKEDCEICGRKCVNIRK